MDFDYFLSRISRIENAPLGGAKSHIKMIPKERKLLELKDLHDQDPRLAAVLALFYPDKWNLTNFLLILRANYDGTHSSQVSFPGGKYEQHDLDLQITALRETSEEVGVEMEHIKVMKKMTDTFIPPSNFLVSPYFGFTAKRPDFVTNHEVEQIIEVKLSDLLNDSSVGTQILTTKKKKNIDVPCYSLNNTNVWGATAMMLSEIKDLIKENLH
ncbi:MAG: CoA pyrophosphatase [Flavobacteriales bacterium]|nr:CoA pyrophosphatase [Flavobacteriales bacterium]